MKYLFGGVGWDGCCLGFGGASVGLKCQCGLVERGGAL